jgi:hypothetical protein
LLLLAVLWFWATNPFRYYQYFTTYLFVFQFQMFPNLSIDSSRYFPGLAFHYFDFQSRTERHLGIPRKPILQRSLISNKSLAQSTTGLRNTQINFKPKFDTLSNGTEIIHKLLQEIWYFSTSGSPSRNFPI